MSSGSTGGAGAMPPAAIPLADGTTLRVDDEGVHLGAQAYRFGQLEDARLISPYPETLGLRVTGSSYVTAVPARPGDAFLALEAIYRRRPDLRPAFAPPPPGAFYGSPTGYPYAAPPPPPYGTWGAPPSPPIPPGGRQPGLGFWPKDIGQVFVTTFRLYFQRFGKLFLLSLAATLPTALITGLFVVGDLYLFGFDITKSYLQNIFTFLNTIPSSLDSSTPPPLPRFLTLSPQAVALVILGGIGLLVVLLLFSAWQTAALAIGAREAVLGRPVRVGAALGQGLRRLFPVLGALVLLGLILIGVYLVALIPIILLSGTLVALNVGGLGRASIGLLYLIPILTTTIFVIVYVIIIFFVIRLGLAPYAAACDAIGPGRAIARSWTLVRGNWWRTFLATFLVGLIASTATQTLVAPMLILPIFIGFLVLLPLVTIVVSPLSAVVEVVIYYDLRLRREGYVDLARQLGLPLATPPPPPAPTPPPPTSPPSPSSGAAI